MSIRTKRPGCSAWAQRKRPQSGAVARSGDSPSCAATAISVISARGRAPPLPRRGGAAARPAPARLWPARWQPGQGQARARSARPRRGSRCPRAGRAPARRGERGSRCGRRLALASEPGSSGRRASFPIEIAGAPDGIAAEQGEAVLAVGGEANPQRGRRRRRAGKRRSRRRAGAARPPARRGSRGAGRRPAGPGGSRSARPPGRSSAKLDLGEELLAAAPGRAQALEGGAVVEARRGQLVVEGARPRSARRPAGARPRGPRRAGALAAQGAAGVAGPLAPRGRPRGGSGGRNARRPSSSGAPTPRPGSARRRSRARPAAPPGSAPRASRRPARRRLARASSTKAVPGRSTVPATAWSASQGWVARERRPVKQALSPPGDATAAPSSG